MYSFRIWHGSENLGIFKSHVVPDIQTTVGETFVQVSNKAVSDYDSNPA